MKNKSYQINSIEQVEVVAKQFLEDFSSARVMAFYGKMGVGKTTFIKSLCQVLEVEDLVNSPSFAIVNEYETAQGESLFHFDFYRLKEVEEAYDMGYEDYVYSGRYCFIEWPERVESILPDDRLDLVLTEQADGKRTLEVKVV